MIFTHDAAEALRAAVWLVNSALDGGGSEAARLDTTDDLAGFFDDFGYTGRLVGDEAELATVQALRGPLRELLTSDRDTLVGSINRILAESHAVPQLVRHDGLDWHIHAISDDEPIADRVLVETAMAMIDVVRLDELDRLGICADDGCDGVVLDLSRNRSRRYCSTACGNRNAVAAYRARHAT